MLSACSGKKSQQHTEKEIEKWPVINVDSIFINLDSPVIKKKYDVIDKVFNNLRKKVGFNGTVLYAEQGRVVYKKAFGFRDVRNRKDELEVSDCFQLSSDSKMFTAEAVMMLKHEGLIDYDADIRTYIPEWPYEGITVRHLLNHRSGLSRYETLADKYWPDKNVPFFNEDMIDYYVKYKPNPYFSPNNGFHYCNVNYALLASIVERVSGEPFASYMKNHIFSPLNMNASYIYEMRDDTLVSQYIEKGVQGYYLSRRRPRQAQNEYLNGVKGDKIMFSNVDDMYRFMTAIDYGLLLPDSIQQEAFKPGSPKAKKRKDNYGFGWRIPDKYEGCVFHYGWWKGYRSFVLKDNVNNKQLIILTNTDKGSNADHFWKVLKDENISLAPASVNISYIETHERHNFPKVGSIKFVE